jgi:hypothetical protein
VIGTGVVDTGGKLPRAGVDTSGKFTACVKAIHVNLRMLPLVLSLTHNFSLVAMTPMVIADTSDCPRAVYIFVNFQKI